MFLRFSYSSSKVRVKKKDGEMKDWPVETQKLISLIGFVICFLFEILHSFAERVGSLTI